MMQFVSGGSAVMEGGILEGEKDVGKVQFQQELSRWFESRGVIADLRSHLRHLMVTALLSTQMGAKAPDRSSPKAQALNLMIAEYLFRHRCHYTLSVFTSEVPTLANFNLDAERRDSKKHPQKNYFQEGEVEEIFNALGLSSKVEEMTFLKMRYLERREEVSLVEVFLQVALELATKVQIQQNLDCHAAEGERILSKEWSSKVVDVLLGEKMTPSQISTVEETILRITENEIKRTAEEQRKSQMQVLSVREKRIQEYLRKHENEIFLRLTEAEKELTTRKDIIEEELIERENHLTKMAVEWNNKHEEILRLSKKFHSIENENRSFKKKLKELEEENRKLRTQEESQSTTIHDLREELNSLINKLKEVTDSNAILSEQIQVLISRGTEEVFRQGGANQPTARPSVEIPLLWSRNTPESNYQKEESGSKVKLEELTAKKQLMPHPDQWSTIESVKAKANGAEPSKPIVHSYSSEDEEDVSSSFADIMQGVQEKLQVLEEESNRLNQSYLEYKLKCISVDSDSESLNNPSTKSPSPVRTEICQITETKFCQTNTEDTFIKIQKLKERKEEKYEFDASVNKKSEVSPKKPALPTPTKRQLQNRDFFLKSRHLVQRLEKRRPEEIQTSLSIPDSYTSDSGEEVTASSKETNRNSPIKPDSLPLLRTPSHEMLQLKNKRSIDSRKVLVESPNHLLKSDADCLALLQEARIKTPQVSARRPLRQQMLLSESEKEGGDENREEERTENFPKSTSSPLSHSSGKVSVNKNTGSNGFW